MSLLEEQIVGICKQHEANSDILLHEGADVRYRDALGNIQVLESSEIDVDELAALISGKPADNAREFLHEALAKQDGASDLRLSAGEFRFRANAFFHGGEQVFGAVLRRMPHAIPTFEKLGLEESIRSWLNNRAGLILVTGPAGSGKTSTLAACVDHINAHRKSHIICIEDPIEYMHPPKQSFITQREVGRDSKTFATSLRAAVRQNPNVIVVGEIRDLDTMETALHAAETGHLVLATLHATSASRAPERVIDCFPETLKPFARAQLSATLIGVLAQMLVPRLDGRGKVLATEAMTNNAEVSSYIRDGKFGQLDNAMAHGGDEPNLWLLNKRLAEMVTNGTVSMDDALDSAYDRTDLDERCQALVNGGHRG